MNKRIDYKLLRHGTKEFLEAVDFAQEFDHEIVEHPNINVLGHYRDDKLIGYSDWVYIPTVYPAFHPKHTRPRDVYRVINDLVTFVQVSGSVAYVGVPTKEGRPNFPNEIMTKIGLTSRNREIYEIKAPKE
jgi:hypothetical protein